jgi:Flp pilus assembly protein TadB
MEYALFEFIGDLVIFKVLLILMAGLIVWLWRSDDRARQLQVVEEPVDDRRHRSEASS